MNPATLANPDILSKTEFIQRMLKLHNEIEHDERPFIVHVTAHREGDEPRDFGTVSVTEREVQISADLDSSESETGLTGMILGMYGDVFVLTAAAALATRADCKRNDASCPQSETDA